MKFIVIGLGSMGKRRVRNLMANGEKDIFGYDLRSDRCVEAREKYSICASDSLAPAMLERSDAIIISTPPDRHLEYMQMAVETGTHFFCESGVFNEGLEEIMKQASQKGIIAAPSQTLRFFDPYKYMKTCVDAGTIGKVLSFNLHYGHYLGDWHPWEDYRKFYVSQRLTGAGREMVAFEMCALHWILGDVETVTALKGKISDLECDIDDTFHIALKFKSGVLGNLHVDVVSKPPVSTFTLHGSDGSLFGDWIKNKVELYNSRDNQWQTYDFSKRPGEEETGMAEYGYVEEISRFIQAVKGEQKYGYTYHDEIKAINVMLAVEQSAETQRHVHIDMKGK